MLFYRFIYITRTFNFLTILEMHARSQHPTIKYSRDIYHPITSFSLVEGRQAEWLINGAIERTKRQVYQRKNR